MELPDTTNIAIPKIIFQTWKTSQVPDKWKTSPESIKKYMPSWKYVLMTDKDNRNFVKDNFPDFLPFYDKFEYPIQRADAIRYCLLYKHGGIYIDLDMELQYPLDELFTVYKGIYLVSSSNVGSCLTNSFMASIPGHPLWLDCIEQMKKPLPSWCVGKHWKVMRSTGPMMIDKVVKENNYEYMALPGSLILPCSVCDEFCQESKKAYIKPLQGQSWIGMDTSIYNFFMCNWKTVAVIFFIIFLTLLILVIYFIFKK